MNILKILKKKLTLVRRAAQEIDDKFRIYLGTEIYFGQDIPEKLERGEVLSMNQRRRVLIEFSPSDNYNYIQQSIQQIQMHGYEVILAHAERYPCLTDDVELAEHIFNMGVDIQVNAGSIIGESGRKIKQFVKTLMDQDMVFGVGTDAHSANRRAPRMKKAAEYVKKKYGEDYMRRIFFSNAATMLRKKKGRMSQNTMINPEVDNDEITIDLTELLMAIWRKLHLVILTGIVVALLAFIGTKLFITPMYTSVTKVYVLSKQEGNASLTYSDLQTGTSLTKDYMELVKSRPVLEQVIAILNLDMKAEELADTITVDTPTDTRILRISVENEDPKTAKEIADAIRESVSIQITEIMDADSVNTVEVGNLPTDPSSPSTMKNMLIGGILGVLLAIGIIVLIYILDDTVKTPEDVEYYLGLNVLTSIPIEEGVKKSKKVKGLSARQFNKKMKK